MPQCSYGTKPKPNSPIIYQLTLDDSAETFTFGTIGGAIAQLYVFLSWAFPVLNVPELCALEPEPPVDISVADVLTAFYAPFVYTNILRGKIIQCMTYKVWFDLCGCKKYSDDPPEPIEPELPPAPRVFPPCPPGCTRPVISYIWYYSGEQAPTDVHAFVVYYGNLTDNPFPYRTTTDSCNVSTTDILGSTKRSDGVALSIPIVTTLYEQYSGSLPPPADSNCPVVRHRFVGNGGITLTNGSYVENTWVKSTRQQTGSKALILVAFNEGQNGNPPTIGASYNTGNGQFPPIPDCVCPDPAPIGPEPQPAPAPLPENIFAFCEDFPELCPKCDDMKITQDTITFPEFSDPETYTLVSKTVPVFIDVDGNTSKLYQAQVAQGLIDILQYIDRYMKFEASGINKDETCANSVISSSNITEFSVNLNLQLQTIQEKLCNITKFDTSSVVKAEDCTDTTVSATDLSGAIQNINVQLQTIQTQICSFLKFDSSGFVKNSNCNSEPHNAINLSEAIKILLLQLEATQSNICNLNQFNTSAIVKAEDCTNTVVTASNLQFAIQNINLQLQTIQEKVCNLYKFDSSAIVKAEDCTNTVVTASDLPAAIQNLNLQLQTIQEKVCNLYKFDSSSITKDSDCVDHAITAANLPAAIQNLNLQLQTIQGQICNINPATTKKVKFVVPDIFDNTGNINTASQVTVTSADSSTVDSAVTDALNALFVALGTSAKSYATSLSSDNTKSDKLKLAIGDSGVVLANGIAKVLNNVPLTSDNALAALGEVLAVTLSTIRKISVTDDPITKITIPDLFDAQGNLINSSSPDGKPTLENPDNLEIITQAQADIQDVWSTLISTIETFITEELP